MDSDGKLVSIAITDKTLMDMTKAVDEQGHKWNLVDGVWQKEFIRPDMSCDTKQGRVCIEFQNVIKQEQQVAKKYFDSSRLQKETPKSFTKEVKYSGDRVRGPREPSHDMMVSIETAKATKLQNTPTR